MPCRRFLPEPLSLARVANDLAISAMAPRTKAPAKRKMRSSVLGKRSQIIKDLASMQHYKAKGKQREMLGKIAEHLENNEDQIEAVHDALAQGFFAGDVKDECLHSSYIYLSKVPSWVEQDVLADVDSRFTQAVVKALKKKDRGVIKQVFGAATLTDPTFHIPVHKISSFKTWAADRARKMAHNSVRNVTWDSTFTIDWKASGVFELAPAIPDGAQAKSHKYTELVFKPTGAKAAIFVRGPYG